jgi:lysophospholipase L1-like esterase
MRGLAVITTVVGLLIGISATTSSVPKRLPTLQGNVRIMIAGDSIAAGFPLSCPDGSSFGDHGAFRDWLVLSGVTVQFVGSKSATCYATDVRHEGHGGATISWLADRIGGMLAANPADVLILRVGVNDAKASGGYRSATQMATDYQRLINNSRTANPAIRILASEQIGPNGSKSAEFARASITVRKFNDLLPSVVIPYGDSVHIGRNSLLTTLNLGDGLHLSTDGYLALAWITINQPDGIWPWLSTDSPASTDTGTQLMIDPFRR